jgi:hypothetical protein
MTNDPLMFTTSAEGENLTAAFSNKSRHPKSRSSPKCAAEHYQNITEHKKTPSCLEGVISSRGFLPHPRERANSIAAHILAQPVVLSTEAVCQAGALKRKLETACCAANHTAAESLDFARDDGAASPSHFEAFAQIKLPTDGIVDEEILGAFALDAPIED